jgi:hypothetical protein
LLSLSEEIEEVIKQLRERQRSIESALNELTRLAEEIGRLEEEQEKSGLSKEEFSIFRVLRGYKVNEPAEMARKIYQEIDKQREWFYNEDAEREIRKELYKLLSREYREASPHRGSERERPIYVTHLTDLVDRVLKMHRILVSGGE